MQICEDEPLTDFCGRLLDAAARAVPDLAEAPLYCIGIAIPRMAGLFVPGLSKVFQSAAEAQGKWHGPGMAVAVDQDSIYSKTYAAAGAAGCQRGAADRHARLALASVVVHELAHAIQRGRAGEDDIMAEGPEIARRAFDNFLADKPLPERFNVKAPAAPWSGHDVRFIRAAAILTTRFPLPLLFAGVAPTDTYGLSKPQFYYNAMKADGDLNRRGTIRDILDEAPGDILKMRWRADVGQWYASLPEPTPEQEKAALDGLALCP